MTSYGVNKMCDAELGPKLVYEASRLFTTGVDIMFRIFPLRLYAQPILSAVFDNRIYIALFHIFEHCSILWNQLN